MPPVRVRDRAVSILALIAAYFCVPSSEGFSAYRTGWIAHVAFSALVAAGITTASRTLGLPGGLTVALALAGVVLLWGVGVLVGVLSHYNPLIMIGGIVVVFAGLALSASMAVGLVIAVVGHALMIPVAVVLKRISAAVLHSAGAGVRSS